MLTPDVNSRSMLCHSEWKNIDHSLETLLELNGIEQRIIDGYWVKLEEGI